MLKKLFFGKKSENQEHKKADIKKHYKEAFGLVFMEIQGADNISVKTIFDTIYKNRGSLQKQTSELNRILKDEKIQWPIYENFIRGKQTVEYELSKDSIMESDSQEILEKLNLKELLKIHLNWLEEKPTHNIQKGKIINKLSSVANENRLIPIKHKLISLLPDPNIINKKEMMEAAVKKVEKLAHSFQRKEGYLESVKFSPYWEFITIIDNKTPDNCKKLNGTIKHYTDQFWQDFYPPCWKPDCRCRVRAHSEKSLRRKGKSIS